MILRPPDDRGPSRNYRNLARAEGGRWTWTYDVHNDCDEPSPKKLGALILREGPNGVTTLALKEESNA